MASSIEVTEGLVVVEVPEGVIRESSLDMPPAEPKLERAPRARWLVTGGVTVLRVALGDSSSSSAMSGS